MEPIHLGCSDTTVSITPVGASIQRLLLPDRDGHIDDVVLGFDTIKPYQDGTNPYFGSIVGRVANRIAEGQFYLNGQKHTLARNNGPNCLHGGIQGFNRVVWDVVERSRESDDESFVTLKYVSADGEEGFPGTVTVHVTYTLSKDGSVLEVRMRAKAMDKPTIVNLAQHSYFNLSGHDHGTVLDHVLWLNSSCYTPLNDVQIPTGEFKHLDDDVAMDFRVPRRIGETICNVPGGYDHNYVLFGLGETAKEHVADGMACSTYV